MESKISTEHTVSPLMILLIILIEGFVSISVEILTIRQLIPFVGNNVTTTSLIIGVFLLFLAYGYKRGGKQKSNFAPKLLSNFTLSALILGIGLSYPFIDIFFHALISVFTPPLLVLLSIYLILVLAPLVYLLGQTVPITMNLLAQQSTAGALGGKVLHMSTIGSFLGAVLTSLVLFHWIGVAGTIFINFVLMFSMVLLLTLKLDLKWYGMMILAALAVIVFKMNVEFESVAFLRTNNYANYSVFETDKLYDTDGLVLDINRTPASYMSDDGRAFDYIEIMKDILFNDMKLEGREILVLGAGGFTLSHGLKDTINQFTYVDIDPDLKGIVEKHFLDEIEGKVISQDARVFVKQKKSAYNVIVNDVYNNPTSIPSHLVTQEYFEDIHDALVPNGYAMFNMIMYPTLKDDYSKRIDNTLRSVFKNCMVIPVHYNNSLQNVVYVCAKRDNEDDLAIYIDDKNLADLDVPTPKVTR